MFMPKCPGCGGHGGTPFRQNGGRCYTCGGAGKVTPRDVLRETSRGRRDVVLAGGRRVGDWLLAESGEEIAWVGAREALRLGLPVLVPTADGGGWEVAKVVGIAGVPLADAAAAPPF